MIVCIIIVEQGSVVLVGEFSVAAAIVAVVIPDHVKVDLKVLFALRDKAPVVQETGINLLTAWEAIEALFERVAGVIAPKV